MHSLVYYSSASFLFSSADLKDILVKSRSNNEKLGITGLLLYHEGSILQILEGDVLQVHELFQKISCDTRHSSIFNMLELENEERNFSEWSMGFIQLSVSDWNELEGYLNLNNKGKFLDTVETKRAEIITLVRSFVQVNLRRVN